MTEPLALDDARAASGPADDAGFGIYVHWPFCLAKCPYCDFNSHVRHGPIDEARYRAGLLAELGWYVGRTPGQRVRSVFFGGGTPSLMAPETVGAVIEAVDRLWGYETGPEITLEANPTSVEARRFAGYRAAGVNRVSLGVQALDDGDLARLGRRHTVAEALAALGVARARFARVSFDLIYARPGQTVAGWGQELGRALDQGVDHLSLYQLTIEPGTRYFDLRRTGRLAVPDDALAADLYEATQETCDRAGLPAYEISNHARAGAECRHNMIYWQGGAWAGVGPGAHARIDTAEGRTALAAERSPERWLERVEANGHGVVEEAWLEPAEVADELLVTALRTSAGLDLARHRRLGGAIDARALAALEADGLVVRDRGRGRLSLTAAGRLVMNQVAVALAG